jgi:dienelactone hydrolase
MPELRLAIEPDPSYYDEPFSIRVDSIAEGTVVDLTAELAELDGSVWHSSGAYRVGADGLIDEPMRTIWSAEASSERRDRRTDLRLALTLKHDGRTCSATATRIDPSVGGGIEPDDPDIEGRLFAPADGTYPPVVLLGGGEGGFHRRHPALIARHGFAVLSMAYFGTQRQPGLVEVPLERFEHALQWLLARPEVRGQRAAVMGGSFGGQAAPLVAATYPKLVCGAIGIAGSGVVTSGIPGHPTLLENWADSRSPFSLNGRPLDFIGGTGAEFERQCLSGGPVQMRLAFETALQDQAAVERATIPVEKIDGPLLFLSGADDQQTPCVELSDIAVRRRQAAGLPVEHIVYPDAGHLIAPPPYGPTTVRVLPMFKQLNGGTPEADAAAREDVWRRVLAFLRQCPDG